MNKQAYGSADVLSLALCEFDKATKTLTVDVSIVSHQRVQIDKVLWSVNGRDVRGFAVQSHKTNRVTIFILIEQFTDRDGDVTHWEYAAYNPTKDSRLEGLTLTLFND